MSAVAVRNMFHAHPEQPSHADAISRCIEACFSCVETCTACADACLAEKHVGRLITCIRLNHDCAAVCAATGSILSRANKVGHRQLLEAQLTTCIAFARACAAECQRHAEMHKHCEVCAKACQHCVDACTEMLSSMRMPA
ncbi:MAG: four-helix bundle copper-binding protein [Pseudomonadota bacterium]